MAKRSRRARKAKARKQKVSKTTAPTPSVAEAGAPATTAGPAHADEYEYVITDLKRVAILALAMFALLIALSFVIR